MSFWLALSFLGALLVPVLAGPVPAGMIVLVKSTNIPQYDIAAEGIADRLRDAADNVVVNQIDYRSSGEDERFWNEIKESEPVLVISIGSTLR